jgi:ketosteroid isomerase-like protein
VNTVQIHRQTSLIALGLTALILQACNHEAPFQNETAVEAEAIKAARMESNQAIARQDTNAIVSFFDEEYVITTGSGVIETGHDAQLGSWREHFDQFPDVVYVRSPTEVTVSEGDSRAIEIGAWVGSRTAEGGSQEKGGRYSAYWRNVDGNWKIRSELFVTLYCEGTDC